MSKYTTEIRFLCEHFSGLKESVGYNSVDEVIEKSQAKIFSFDYPIFDNAYKKGLEKKILKHYYTREICAETFGRWQLFLESRLLEIMPYYNQLYESTLIKYDIFEDVNYTRTGSRSGEESGNTSGTGKTVHSGTDTTNRTDTLDGDYHTEGEAWSLYSDTPQGSVGNIDNLSYLTNATKNTNEEDSSSDETRTTTGTDTHAYTDNREDASESSKNTLEEYTELIKGKNPGSSYMQMIQDFRATFLNIDKMIIDDLSDLFMTVY